MAEAEKTDVKAKEGELTVHITDELVHIERFRDIPCFVESRNMGLAGFFFITITNFLVSSHPRKSFLYGTAGGSIFYLSTLFYCYYKVTKTDETLLQAYKKKLEERKQREN